VSKIDLEEATILLKSWETLQDLAKSNGETAWKVRVWGISVWSALVAYSFNESEKFIILVSVIAIVAVFLVELAVRQIQYQFIARSLEIERVLNASLIGDALDLPEKGISTNIDTPVLKDFLELFRLKRWLIWFPYLIIILFSVVAWNIVG
jgi:hypothetical protein